ncbi:MAG: diguanylate cyclase [Gallionella sp.]
MPLSPDLKASLFSVAVNQSTDGITIVDARLPDMPLVYVNSGFEKMTGYRAAELLGKNCRLLQGKEPRQHDTEVLREAIRKGESCVVMLRNFRKDGSMFWNEFNLSPVRDETGVVTHFIGMQKDVTARVEMLKHLRQSKADLQTANAKLNIMAMTDALTMVGNRRHFDERFDSLLSMAQRSKITLAVLMIDLDYFKSYNDLYGHQAGDECLRRVGACIAESFQRPSDCVARYGGEEFAVLIPGVCQEELQHYSQQLCEKIFALEIPHQGSVYEVVTISVGGIVRTPKRDAKVPALLKLADTALYQAKQAGRNRVAII